MKGFLPIFFALCAVAHAVTVDGKISLAVDSKHPAFGQVTVAIYRQDALARHAEAARRTLNLKLRELRAEEKKAPAGSDTRAAIDREEHELAARFWPQIVEGLASIASTKTDADGRFRVIVPQGEMDPVLVAIVSDPQPGAALPRQFVWALRHTVWEKPLLLTNKNTLPWSADSAIRFEPGFTTAAN